MTVGELGQTRDPRALVPGDTAALRTHATALTNRGNTLLQVGDNLRRINTREGWSGDAADAFRTKFTPHPSQWLTAGDSHQDAATAISHYADTLEWAQTQAGTAAHQWDQADTATQTAAASYRQAAAQGASLAPFVDPGAALRNNAQATLARARDQVAHVGDSAARTVATATEPAPQQSLFPDDIGSRLEGVAETIGGLGVTALGTVVAGASALVVAGSGVVDLTVAGAAVGVPVGALAVGGGVVGVGLMAGGVGMISEGIGSIIAPSTMTIVPPAPMTVPFAKKQQPPQLTAAEQQALADKAAGKPFDPKLAKAAQGKGVTGEKYGGDRNAQKRADDKKNEPKNK